MQKTLFIKISIIAGLCLIFAIGLNLFSAVIYERQSYADSVVAEIAEQHVNPQEIITPFIAIPTTITPACVVNTEDKTTKCAASYSMLATVFASQTAASQNLTVSTDTYQRGIYHATSYNGEIKFDQRYALSQTTQDLNGLDVDAINSTADPSSNPVNTAINPNGISTEKVVTHWNDAKLIIPVSDLRGVATLPTVTINKQSIKAMYPQRPMLKGLTYVEVALPQSVLAQLKLSALTPQNAVNPADASFNSQSLNSKSIKPIEILIDLPLSGISNLNTVPTGQNFELAMRSNWHAPNFIGKALPNAKTFSPKGFDANWQNQYLTVANNQAISQCLGTPNNQCTVTSTAFLNNDSYAYNSEAAIAVADAAVTNGSNTGLSNVSLNSFGVSFAEPNDVYLQTERTMKYALLLILVSFGTFFLFEIIKSNRIHPIQYLLVGCALLVFYVLLLPLAEQIAFWQAYAIAASACVGLIGWYTYYVLGGMKRAAIFTTVLAGLYAAFYGILTTEDLNLLLGAVFCFVLLACVMVMTRKIDWYKIA